MACVLPHLTCSTPVRSSVPTLLALLLALAAPPRLASANGPGGRLGPYDPGALSSTQQEAAWLKQKNQGPKSKAGSVPLRRATPGHISLQRKPLPLPKVAKPAPKTESFSLRRFVRTLFGKNETTTVRRPAEKNASLASVKAGLTKSSAKKPLYVTQPVSPELAHKDAQALNKALKGVFVDEKTVHDILENRPAHHVAAVREAFDLKYGPTWKGGSLRGALNQRFYDSGARRVLGALDTALARVRRAAPGGDEGRVQANIDKVFELHRLRTKGYELTESDLVNHHDLTRDNHIRLLVDGTQAFSSIFQALRTARQTIHVSYYILNDDKLGRAFAGMLKKKVAEGVEVRLMVDGIGSMQMLGSPKRRIISDLEKAGVQVIRNHVVNPLGLSKKLNHPDHRKLVIIDGTVGFTGGMNVGTHYISEYHDLMVRLEGSAVHQMQAEWLTSWMLLGGRIDNKIKDEQALRERYFPRVDKAPGTQKLRTVQHVPGENKAILKTYVQRINSARESIYIENPYMTNHIIQEALTRAARRGVKVHVVLPGQNDHGFSHWAARAKYPGMLEAGVKIYEYPGFNHGKVMVTDGRFVTIGSSNLDDVALRHIYELNLNVHDQGFAQEVIERVFVKDIQKSRPMTVQMITPFQKAMGHFWNLFAYFI